MFVDPSRLYEEEAQGRRGSFPFCFALCIYYTTSPLVSGAESHDASKNAFMDIDSQSR